jgi:ribosomal protein L11 methyltransferase
MTRVDILAEKGTEESLDHRFYAMCSGLWIEESQGKVLIKCYPTDTDTFLSLIGKSVAAEGVTVIEEEEKDYVSLVRRHFTPIKIGDVTILPPWRRATGKGMHIIIEPGMAFGTGRHESTKMMMKLIGSIDMRGKRVLDIGSGSGILAIYAWLSGAASVTAIDHDPLAAEAIAKGCSLNHCEEIVFACSGIEGIRGRFDVVLANLDFDTFKAHSPAIIDKVENGGYLVVSGIEEQYEAQAVHLFKTMLLVRRARMKDWRSFVFRQDEVEGCRGETE